MDQILAKCRAVVRVWTNPTSASILPPANEVWGKVIFSQVFVCVWGGDVWLPSIHHRSHDQEGLHPGGGSAAKGGGLHPGGYACKGVGQTPIRLRYMGYGQQAGDTHPTGMHSCCVLCLFCRSRTVN